jgi:menaquinone-specific isochorismate synthase
VSPDPRGLVARTRSLDGPVDLVGRAGGDGLLLANAGRGVAAHGAMAHVPQRELDAWLAAVAVDDEVERPGTGAIAFGALPFRPDDTTALVVPEVVWGADGDGAWVTTIGPADAPPTVPDLVAAPTAAAPADVTVTSVRDPAWWCELVAQATDALKVEANGLSKVVLAREVLVEADQPFDRGAVLRRLEAAYPGCFLYELDDLVGASPELLVERRGEEVRAQPMAGTARRDPDPEVDAGLAAALMASPTYRHEHQITIDMVYDTLLPWCSYLDYEAEPSIVAVANVQHLATSVAGRLSQPAPSVLALVAALHPTPAVSGWPCDSATRWIEAHEGFDRGRYGGTVGWVDGAGNGTWAVAIRGAEVAGRRARVIAGNGIVADSDPATELAETEAKLAAMLGALRG